MITTWEEARDAFEELIDELHPAIDYGFTIILASYALREADPIAYREGLLGYLDGEGVDTDELGGYDR